MYVNTVAVLFRAPVPNLTNWVLSESSPSESLTCDGPWFRQSAGAVWNARAGFRQRGAGGCNYHKQVGTPRPNKDVPDSCIPGALSTVRMARGMWCESFPELSAVSVTATLGVITTNHAENRIEIASWKRPKDWGCPN
jgi:hypothetical protein